MCSKKPGLSLLLGGYAACPETANAPKLGGNFKEPAIPLGDKAHYTLRLLPPGFAYLYNPADRLRPWQGFIITQQGYYYPLRIDKYGPDDTWVNSADLSPCKPDQYGADAQAITIPRAEEAGDVWVCYSTVRWTKEVWQRFNDNADGCRDKVMQKFNVAAWLASPKAEHAALVSEMAGKIVEFSGQVNAKAFDFSANPLQQRAWSLQDWGKIAEKVGAPAPLDPMSPTQEEAAAIAKKLGEARKAGMPGWEQDALFKSAKFGAWDILAAKFERLCAGSPKTAGKGLVLALKDTVGVTSDLATLVSHANKRFVEHTIKDDPGLYRKHVTSQSIRGVREMICTRAIQQEQKAALARKEQSETGRRFVSPVQAGDNPEFHDAFLLPPEEYKPIADRAWEVYKPFYKEDGIKAFEKQYAQALSDWNDAEIASLSEAHGKWLGSADLAATMQYHFDPANLDSGRAYARAVSLCIGSGQETAEVRQVIEEWVNGEVTDLKNLYLRALVFNQEEAAKAAVQLIGQINGKPFYQQLDFWKGFLDNGFACIEYALKHDNSVERLLLAQGAGVIMEAIQEAARTANAAAGYLAHWAAILGGIGGQAVGFVRGACSSPKGLLNFVSNRIYASLASTGSAFPSQGHRVIDTIFHTDMLGRATMQPEPGGASIEANFMVAVDKGKISAKMADTDIDNLIGTPMKGQPSASPKRPLFGIDRGGVFGDARNVGLVHGTVGFFFNLAAAGNALAAYREGGKRHPELQPEFAQNELSARLGTAIIACVAGFADSVSAAMQRALPPTRLAQGLGFRLNVSLKLIGKGGGALASGIVAYRDFVGLKEAIGKGKDGRGLIIASIATFTIDFAAFGLLAYSFATYVISLIGYLRTGAAIAEVTSITAGGATVSIAGPLMLLFVVGFAATSWRESERLKGNLKGWLSRSIFGDGSLGATYSDLSIEQGALNTVF
jgi:hypothetical protein